jgi:arylsulfatase A-like enzyme
MNLDIYPTLFHLAGVEEPRDRVIDGTNIFNILSGSRRQDPHEMILFYHYDLLEGIRIGRWKYFDKMNRYVWPIALDTAPVPNRLGGKQMGTRWPLLYDLENDPGEHYNVINTFPEVAARLRSAMENWERAAKNNPRGFGAA